MKVAVIGCGLAGLRSAMLLEGLGHEVLLFEARDRPGGRVHTSPSGFEEGAEWIDEDQHRMRALLRQLSISEVPAPPGDYLLSFRGDRCHESEPWRAALADMTRFEEFADSDAPASTIGDIIDATCFTDAGKWLVAANIRTDEGDEPGRLGAKQWREFRKLYQQREGNEGSAFRIDGGGSAFIDAMLAKITATPKFGSQLLKIDQHNNPKLEFEGFTVEADAAIVAVPLPCVPRISFNPPLSVANEITKIGFAPAFKARFVFNEPFWKNEGWHGYLKTDSIINQTWPDRENPNALIAYIVGDAARTLSTSPNPQEALRNEWEKWPATPTEIELKNWTADPLANGAFSLALPGSNPAALRKRDAQPIQLAGEYCAEWMGFMEGALESAETAVSALS